MHQVTKDLCRSASNLQSSTSDEATLDAEGYVRALATRARAAAALLARLTADEKNAALEAIASALERDREKIFAANAEDIAAAVELDAAKRDRLTLTPARFEAMVAGVRHVATLADPVGETLWTRERPSGIAIRKVRVPFGVIAVVFESRPNVFVDTAALCLKSGNAVILRGGREALRTNAALYLAVREGLGQRSKVKGQDLGQRSKVKGQDLGQRSKVKGQTEEEKFHCLTSDLGPLTLASTTDLGPLTLASSSDLLDAVAFVDRTDHACVTALVRAVGLVDVAIPRGGERLIRAMCEAALVPVLKHYKGVCHLYVDDRADLAMALSILDNGKTQRTGVCNALECLLVHERLAPLFLPMVRAWAQDRGVVLHVACGDEVEGGRLKVEGGGAEIDWEREFLALEMNVGVVADVDAAVAHINRYGSHHSDAIVTNDAERAARFLRDVDSACVYHNASTRFTDGAEFGMGAEIGISTDKLHARGPMGLEELTTYKYLVTGDGTIRC